MILRLLATAVLVSILGGARCQDAGGTRACRTNVECGAYKSCETATGRCKCVDDRACGSGEFCNALGQCQVQAGCQDNTDCELLQSNIALVCDLKSGQCMAADQCFDDVQCPLGRVCDNESRSCIQACRDEADCVLGAGCLRDPPNTVLGRCVYGSCSRTDQCPVGEQCDLATARCVPDDRGPFCGACQRFDPLDPQCGEPSNYCLIDTGDPARRSHYCGVDCSQEQGCPNGYECKDVIIVGPPATPACNVEDCANNVCTTSGAPCQSPFDCPLGPPGGDCRRAHLGVCAGTVDQDCTADADCGGSVGSCVFAVCRLRERAAYGFCACVVDSDCPADDCRNADLSDPANPVAGNCLLSGHRCYAAEDCNVIACVNGGCLIGRNCKPGMDRRCADLQTGSSSGSAE